MPIDLLVIPLGDVSKADAEDLVANHFGAVSAEWLDRRDLRRRPLATAWRLARRRHEGAVLIARDLRASRLRLTSLLLGLTRARTCWRMDLGGAQQCWSLRGHVAANAGAIARHMLACLLAAGLSVPMLTVTVAALKPRRIRMQRPKHVLYLRSQLWLGLRGGGSVAHTAGVIDGLEQAGVAVRVVSSDHLAGVQAPISVQLPEMWFDGWLREFEELAYNVAFFGAAWRAARDLPPDALYQRHAALNCAGAILSRVLGIPLVLEFNSSEVWKGRYWGGLHLVRAAELVERINLRAADRVVVVSDVLRRELLHKGVPDERIVVNPNGVDPLRFRPDAGGAEVRAKLGIASAVVVGFSGTFGAWHGISTLASAIPGVLAARAQVRWLLIGDGPLRSSIPNDSERVIQIGMLPHAEMPRYLAACDVLVSPHGRQADGGEFFGSPTKLYEYMAVGRPIVASGIGQIAEVLVNGQSGLLVPPDDPVQLTEAIVRLVDDACLRARLGATTRQAAAAHHTWRRNAERVLESLAAS